MHVCVKASVCKGPCVQKRLCVQASWCKNCLCVNVVCVQKCHVCVKASVCEETIRKIRCKLLSCVCDILSWYYSTRLPIVHLIYIYMYIYIYGLVIEGSLEVKLPTIWTDEKQSRAEAERRRKIRREKSRRERVRKKKMPMRQKVGKSRNTVYFRMKWGSLKRRVRSQLARWEIEKLHAVVARSHYITSQNVQNTPGSDHFWKLRCRKSARRCGAKHISKSKCTKHTRSQTTFWKLRCRKSARRCGAKHVSKSKCTKHTRFGPLLEVAMSKKCTPFWREAHFEVENVTKHHMFAPLLEVQMSFRVAGARDCAPCQKWAKREVFCRISKNDGRCGTFEEDLQRCMLRGRRSTNDMFMRDVRRSGRWFPERGCILEHPICRFAKMILRDRCSTSHDLASIFRGRRSTLDRWSGKIPKRIGTRLSALALYFPFFKEVSQNCLVFDVVKFKTWRSLAELLCFGGCQIQKLQTSRRIVSFLLLSTSKNEEVSQESFIFKLADRQGDRYRQTDRQTERERDRQTDRQTDR